MILRFLMTALLLAVSPALLADAITGEVQKQATNYTAIIMFVVVINSVLGVAQEEFDCLLTADRSLVYQQSLPRFEISVLVLRAKTNRLEDLAPLIPRVLAVLPTLRPGQSAEIS